MLAQDGSFLRHSEPRWAAPHGLRGGDEEVNMVASLIALCPTEYFEWNGVSVWLGRAQIL
jgi:hypothetical protein